MCLPITLPLRAVRRHTRGVGGTRMQRLARVLVLLLLCVPSVAWAVDAGDEVGPQSAGAQRYTTKPGDTLWDIAMRFIRDDGISPPQMMLALRDANPGAFVDGNINNLKSGYMLRLPPRETILAIGVTEAATEVARQNALWREPGARSAAPTPGAAEVAAASPAPVATEAISEDTGVRTGADGQDTAPQQHDPVLTQEPAHRPDSDNEALRARVAALEDKLATLDGIIAMQHERLAELRQRRAAETLAREREPPPTPGGGEDPAAKPPPPSRDTWFADPNIVIPLSAAAGLGLVVIWLLRRRATANRTALDSAPSVAEQTGAERLAAAAGSALAIGRDDLDLGPQEGATADHPREPAEPIGPELAAGEAEDRLAELSIGLDDLELGFEPPGEDARR